jgi:hypothetical protein
MGEALQAEQACQKAQLTPIVILMTAHSIQSAELNLLDLRKRLYLRHPIEHRTADLRAPAYGA